MLELLVVVKVIFRVATTTTTTITTTAQQEHAHSFGTFAHLHQPVVEHVGDATAHQLSCGGDTLLDVLSEGGALQTGQVGELEQLEAAQHVVVLAATHVGLELCGETEYGASTGEHLLGGVHVAECAREKAHTLGWLQYGAAAPLEDVVHSLDAQTQLFHLGSHVQ